MPNSTNHSSGRYLFPLIVMSVLFFMVGFITTLNNSLIDFLASSKWMLSFSEKQLVNTAFFGAYLFSIPLSWLLTRLGYKSSALLSIAVVGIGFISVCLSIAYGYYYFLSSMFIVALGIALLQIVLNPYVIALGDKKSAASRLNIVGFFNSAAAVMAPAFVALLISTEAVDVDISAELRPDPAKVIGPFTVIIGLCVVLLITLRIIKLPEISNEDTTSGEYSDRALHRTPHLMFGAIGIFIYMGIELGVPSFLLDRMKAMGVDSISFWGIELQNAGILILYWGGLVIGRCVGAILLQRISGRTMMTSNAILAMVLLAAGLSTNGTLSVILISLCGLCNSIMWGALFDLASADLGNRSQQASGIICTFAIGGAILPPLMGLLQESFGEDALTIGTNAAFACLFVYYAYIVLYSKYLSQIRLTKPTVKPTVIVDTTSIPQ